MKGTVLITGASSGIGAATARRLSQRDFSVWGTSRNPAALGSDAPEIQWLPLDLQDEPSIQAAVAEILDKSGSLDAVVCNAGSGIFGSLEEVSLEDARAQFETNVIGTIATLRATLPAIRVAHGRVVLVGSLAGRAPIPFQGHYSATKAAIEALAHSLANELHAHRVSVSLVEPGDMQTGFNDNLDFEAVPGSVYGAPMERCKKIIRDSLVSAPSPDGVAAAIEHALTSRRPRFRYAVGKEALGVALGKRLMPDRLSHWVLRRYFQL